MEKYRYIKKQIIIIVVCLFILALIVGGIFLLTRPKAPTCFDSIQNQGEIGVDCGGPCSLCPQQLQKNLEIISTKAIKTQDNYVDVVAKIKNLNRDFGVKLFSYVFDLYDSAGNLISSKQGSSYILPQKTKYIIEQKILANSEVSNIDFKIIDVTWQELVDYEEPELLIRGTDFKQSQNSTKVSSILENRSNYAFDKIDIQVILSDKDSRILAVGKTNLRTVLSKESRYFEIGWFFPIGNQAKEADIIARTNVFLDENFMRRYGEERQKFQEY